LPTYIYGNIAFLLSTTFLIMAVKVPQERKLKGTKVVCGATFHGCKSSMERKFLEHSLPGSKKFRKFHGSESFLYGLFAPVNKSAEERKGQIPWYLAVWEHKITRLANASVKTFSSIVITQFTIR